MINYEIRNMEYSTLLLSVLYISSKNVFCAESCLEIILSDRRSLSGLYSLQNQNNEVYDVYCVFDRVFGYTYISSDTPVNFNISKHYTTKSHAKLRFYNKSLNTQGEVKVTQIKRFQDQQLGFMLNEFSGYNSPNLQKRFTYLYLGFVPRDLIRKNEVQGYKAENEEYTFTNCDGSQNCYFAFVFGAKTVLPKHFGNILSKGWILSAKNLSRKEHMHTKFYFSVKISMGGCGGLATTTGLDEIKGSLGLPFEIPPACQHNPCLNNGTCTEDRAAYFCSCLPDYTGDQCQNVLAPKPEVILSPFPNNGTEKENITSTETCLCPCTAIGQKWAHVANLNLTRPELRLFLQDEIEQLQRELIIEKKKTNFYYRSRNSVSDNRKSAVSTGLVGIVLLCVSITIMVTFDVMSFCLRRKKRILARQT